MASTSVDPTNIPKRLTRSQLEDFVFFGILVANKEAAQTRRKLDALYESMRAHALGETPFDLVRLIDLTPGLLVEQLKTIRTGQYRRIERAFREVIRLDVRKLTLDALEAVHGIGPKTARFILLYSQPNAEVVPLDTHVLKYLAKLGYRDVPKSTPSPGKTYRHWEEVFIAEAKKAGMTIRAFDTFVWKSYAKSAHMHKG